MKTAFPTDFSASTRNVESHLKTEAAWPSFCLYHFSLGLVNQRISNHGLKYAFHAIVKRLRF